MILTSDQQRALDTINGSRSQTITLGGHSGTGKTSLVPFVCAHALERAGPTRMVPTGRKLDGDRSFSPFEDDQEPRETAPVVVTAPTKKAVKVIRAKLREAGLGPARSTEPRTKRSERRNAKHAARIDKHQLKVRR